jgi:hypothetical protein
MKIKIPLWQKICHRGIIRLEQGNYGALISAFDVSFDFIASQGLHQSNNVFIVFMAFSYGNDIAIGGGSNGFGIFYSQSFGNLKTGFNGIVAIDNGNIYIFDHAWNLSRFDFIQVQILGILDDIVFGYCQICPVFELDQALSL